MTDHPVGPIAQAIVKGLRAQLPPDALIPDPIPREPRVREEAQTRDEARNQWLNHFHRSLYEDAKPPEVSRDFLRGKPTLGLTMKFGADHASGGMHEFPHIDSGDLRRSCSAFFQDGGVLCLWSLRHGTGKTTFALWHIIRHLRILAEGVADEGRRWGDQGRDPMPSVTFASWPACYAEIKAQFGRRKEERVVEKLQDVEILVLENIKHMGDFEHSTLEGLLGARYSAEKRTILALRAVEGRSDVDAVLGQRIMSFVSERGFACEVGGDGFRTSSAPTSVATPF